MKVFIAAAAVLACAGAHAQVYKCQEGGKTVYSQAPCPAGGQLLDSSRAPAPAARPGRAATFDPSTAQPVSEPSPAPAMVGAVAQCPSEQDIRNMETSASSIRMSARDKLQVQARINAARACRNGVTPAADRSAVEAYDERAAQRRAAAAARAPATVSSCDATGCWDTSGRHYSGAAGGMYRSDGSFCQRNGNQMTCQ